MDAVMFEAKAVHLSLQRVGRGLLRRYRNGLTPARFDLMNSLGLKGMKQSDLWKRLNVVRSVISEMLGSLRALGWVKRVRAADGRTWLVMLTQRGREVFRRAFDECVEGGDATVHMDYGLANGHAEVNVLDVRERFLSDCSSVTTVFRTMPWLRGPSLYADDPEDYYFALLEVGDPVPIGGVPFAT